MRRRCDFGATDSVMGYGGMGRAEGGNARDFLFHAFYLPLCYSQLLHSRCAMGSEGEVNDKQ